MILGLYAGKSNNLIGLGIFHGDLDFFDLHEKSLDLSNYEIFPHKILKSRTFKKNSILIVTMYMLVLLRRLSTWISLVFVCFLLLFRLASDSVEFWK